MADQLLQIATFYTHTGAMEFYALLKEKGEDAAEIGPVPRRFSVSCGTGVRFYLPFKEEYLNPDVEFIYRAIPEEKDKYDRIWSAED